MAINITPKNDYSYLFGSLNSNSGSGSLGNLNFLSDYASIKNGSYGKLMKAYYNQSASDEVSSIAGKKNSVSADESKDLKAMQSTTDALKESADKLLSKALFEKKDVTTKAEDGTTKTVKDYDKEAIYNAVADLVDDYNAVLKASDKINTESILNKTTNLASSVVANESMLSKLGITVGKDSSLKIDKEAFMKVDMGSVKSVFNGNGSLSYRISAQSSLINFATTNEINRSNTYSANGTYTSTYASGDLFNSFF